MVTIIFHRLVSSLTRNYPRDAHDHHEMRINMSACHPLPKATAATRTRGIDKARKENHGFTQQAPTATQAGRAGIPKARTR